MQLAHTLALLALCLCAGLSTTAAQPLLGGGAVAPAAPGDLPPAPNCDGVATRPGGWSRTADVPEDVYSAIQVQLVENNSTLAAAGAWCDDPATTTLEACSQVVAGTNFEVVAELSCAAEGGATVRLRAEVYVPLPSSNEEPEVVSLDVLSVDGAVPQA